MRKASVTAILAGCAVLGSIAAGLAAGTGGQSALGPEGPKSVGFGASLSTDQRVYRSGEPIRITFEVFNHTPRPARFDFTSGQRFDIVIEDQQGKEVWRWSEGRLFTMALGQETLGPATPRLTYEAEHTAKLEPGRYKIKGLLTDVSRRISATISVEVQ